MKLQFKLFGMPGSRLARRESARLSPQQRAARQAHVENVIDGIEPRMRLVRGYQKKLQPAVSAARAYIDGLVEQIPGPLDVAPKAFVSDPHVNAFFATPQEVRAVFGGSSELAAFFAEPANAEVDSACALLCMVRQHKKVLGVELAHGTIRRDVSQTAVNFSDHKVLSPAANEADVRRGLKECIFNALISHALQHIADVKAHKRKLQDQRRILYARLRARQAHSDGFGLLLNVARGDPEETGQIQEKLAAAEQRLRHLPAVQDAPRHYLNEVRSIMARPQAFIKLKRVALRLNKMGIKVHSTSRQTAHTVELAEINISNVMQRVVVIVRYPRAQMLPRNQATAFPSSDLKL
jgi:hypothetical protein